MKLKINTKIIQPIPESVIHYLKNLGKFECDGDTLNKFFLYKK